jgi:predicted Kef-type K+ transport protein
MMDTTPIWLVDAAWISFAFFCGFLARLCKLPPLIGFLAGGLLFKYRPGRTAGRQNPGGSLPAHLAHCL